MVPTTSTLYWVDTLREMFAISDQDPWREFHSGDLLQQQDAGIEWGMDGLNFYKIKGAGHFPYYEQGEVYWYVAATFVDGGSLRFNTRAKH